LDEPDGVSIRVCDHPGPPHTWDITPLGSPLPSELNGTGHGGLEVLDLEPKRRGFPWIHGVAFGKAADVVALLAKHPHVVAKRAEIPTKEALVERLSLVKIADEVFDVAEIVVIHGFVPGGDFRVAVT
jgi:hypothetical protein